MILTLHDLRHGCASRWLYRWLRHHFPRGGHYGAIYRALIQAERLDWASALAEYGWARGYTCQAFIREDIGTMMHLAERLSSLRNAAAPLPPRAIMHPRSPVPGMVNAGTMAFTAAASPARVTISSWATTRNRANSPVAAHTATSAGAAIMVNWPSRATARRSPVVVHGYASPAAATRRILPAMANKSVSR